MRDENATNWFSAVPLDILHRAYREAHGELAWSRPDAVQVVRRLHENGYRVIGVDIWIPTHPGPTIPTPFVYDWSEPAYKLSAIDFIETFEWDATDSSHRGMAPYFSLTVDG